MATLYKRSTPMQRRMFRAIEGAVRNTAHCHPGMKLDTPNAARSIAKRAVGTLTASVLADRLSAPSICGDSHSSGGDRPWSSPPSKETERGALPGKPRRSPLKSLWESVSNLAGRARKAGELERAAALVEVLRLIAAEQRKK